MQAVREKKLETPVKASNLASANYSSDTLGLSFYSHPPKDEISVTEFQGITLDRLKVLHAIDRSCGFDVGVSKIAESKAKLEPTLIESKLLLRYPMAYNIDSFLQDKEDFQRRDSVSHFALLFVFCKTRDMRQWFLRQEQRLFVLRFEALNPRAKEAFLETSGLDCQKFDPVTSGISLKELQEVTPGAQIWRGEGPPELDANFYQMPFQLVNPSLISGRRVVLKKGKAFFPSSALKEVLSARLKESLSVALDTAFQNLEVALQDARIGDFLRGLQQYGPQLLVTPQSSGVTDDIGVRLTTENFEEMMLRSFPPCMRRLVEHQRLQRKHLKHAGRLQLRPFLKECGFTYEESISWWAQELGRDPEIDGGSFEKHYRYDVDHAYGKKGHHQGQNAFGCPKIINFPAEAVGQCHGCVFRHLDLPALKKQLHEWHVPAKSMMEIENLVTRGSHYQLACIEYFRAMHPGHDGEGVGNTPKDYFRESCRTYIKPGTTGKGGAGQAEDMARAKGA